MSDEQKMPDVIRCYWANESKTIVDVARGVDHSTDTPYLRCPDNIDPDDAAVVSRKWLNKIDCGLTAVLVRKGQHND